MDYFICYEDQHEFPNFVDDFISDFYPHLKTNQEPQYWEMSKTSTNFMMTVIKDKQVNDYAWPDTYDMGGFHLSCSHRLLDYVEKSLPLNQINEKNFDMGIIIDFDQKKISYWIDGCVDPVIEEQMKKIWQGWDISWHIKGLPYHFYLTGRDPRSVMMPYEELWSEMSHFEHLAKGDKLENWLSREEYYELWDTL